jgi:CO/xanthine dehydrogenase FAD-binding subunit
MIPFSFAYIAPDTLQEASDAYSDFANRGLTPLYFTGGTEIITMGRVGSLRFDAVIDLKCIPEMKGFKKENNILSLGAAETLNDVACLSGFPLLAKCCQRVADHTAQCKITLGGNIAGTVIYHEAVLALILSEAKAELFGPIGSRTVSLNALFTPMLTLKPGEFFVRFSFDMLFAGLPFVHAKHVVSEKIGYPLFTLVAIRREDAMEAAISGLYRYPFCLHFPLASEGSDPVKVSDQLHSQMKEAPLSDVSSSAEYRLFRLEGALHDAMIKLGGTRNEAH